MLVLSRDCDSAIRIGPDITVKVLSIRKQRVKLGVVAPASVRVWRDEIAPESFRPSEAEVSPPSSNGVPFPILVVEDDPDHAKLITLALGHCLLSPVTIVANGKAAIEALSGDNGSSLHPHLVFLDLNLPDISGLEVLRRIRATPGHGTTPIVIFSSEENDAIVSTCLEAGANAFVNKATRFQDFCRSVTRVATFWSSDCRIPKTEAPQSA